MARYLNKSAELAGEKPILSLSGTPSNHKRPTRRMLLLAAIICIAVIVAKGFSLIYNSPLHIFPASNKCSSISIPILPGFRITSVQSHEVYKYSFPGLGTSGLEFCNVTVALTHEGAHDSVTVSVWLPLQNWNGRFLGAGGGGLVAGNIASLAFATSNNYVGASTDAGLTLGGTIDPSSGKWALHSDGTLNIDLVKNFADRSIHDMVVISKAVVEIFYGHKPRHSYYMGCSTGGRMGYFAAQKHPGDFDGILADSPAIASTSLVVADFWPPVVMENITAPPQCVFEQYRQDIIKFCDPLDGVEDGLISDLSKCTYNAERLISSKVTCPGGEIIITSQHSDVVNKILDGPRSISGEKLFVGIPPGASFTGTANTITINGTTTPAPFLTSEYWIKYFVAQDPDYDARHMTFSQFEEIFANSVRIFNNFLGDNDPDLSGFKARGGKLLTWHGLADQIINPEVIVTYRQQLEKKMGGAKSVDEFQRLFLAPGAGHCAGGIGPVPNLLYSLGVLQKWVELGVAPDTLAASTNVSGTLVTRDLCRYPRLLKYNGEGDTNAASSFSCE